MSTEITAYTPPTQTEIEYTWNLASKLCKTEFVPANLRNKPEAVLAVFLTGRELGIGPMQSLRDIYPVNGRPALMASLMVARVRTLGHKFTTLQSTDTQATVQIHRRGESEPQPPVMFTQADARRAGLLDKAIWRQYPTAMHWNRAASAACRRDCPEALGGAVYTPEEIEDGHGTTTATWGSPEGPPLPDETSDPGKASAPPRPTGSDTDASVTGPGPAQEPPNAEAPTPRPSPTSPGRGRGQRSRPEVPGSASAGDLGEGPPAGPTADDDAAEQAAFDEAHADPGRGTR
jgi:hypothetical protein